MVKKDVFIEESIQKHGKSLIPVLQDIQKQYRYLPEEALEITAAKLNLALRDVYGVASFYQAFSFTQEGEYKPRESSFSLTLSVPLLTTRTLTRMSASLLALDASDPSSIHAKRPCGPQSASTVRGDSPQSRGAPATSHRSLLQGPECQSCKSCIFRSTYA